MPTTSDLQKLTMRREDVDALEDAADELMREASYYSETGDRGNPHATRLYALALRLRTEAGWQVRLSDAWSERAPSNVRELRRG